MDWNSRRITAILENALNEDRATSDATSYACIDPNQRASATIIANEECILAGSDACRGFSTCMQRWTGGYFALRGDEPSFDFRRNPSEGGATDGGDPA